MLNPTLSQPLSFSTLPCDTTNHLLTAKSASINLLDAIIYSYETYGTCEAFRQSEDFVRAKEQYCDLFIFINHFIAQYCLYPDPIQKRFSRCLEKILSPLSTHETVLLYGEGKKGFEFFCFLLRQDNLSTEKKLAALCHLADHIKEDLYQLPTHLLLINQQLQYAMEGMVGEALHIQAQLIKQFVQAFNHLLDEEVNIAHATTYMRFLKTHYAPFLPVESEVDVQPGITKQDLVNCMKYVKEQLTPYAVISTMANRYVEAIQRAISLGPGFTYQLAQGALSEIQAKLFSSYGEVPSECFFQNKEGLYYIDRPTKLLKLVLLQNLSRQIFSPYPPSLLYHYPILACKKPVSPLSRQVEKTVHIYQVASFYWVEISGESSCALLTLAHLNPLQHLNLPFALIHEAIQNSTATLQRDVPLWIQNRTFFKAYLCHIFKNREKKVAALILHFFSKDTTQQDIIGPSLIHTFKQFELDVPLIKILIKAHSHQQEIISLLAQTLTPLFAHTSFPLIHNEGLLYRLLKVGLSLETTDQDGNTLLMWAATQGWDGAVNYLYQHGVKINAVNHTGQTAMMLVALHGHEKMVDLLFNLGASLEITSPALGNVLAHAVKGRHIPVIEKLLHLSDFYSKAQHHYVFDGVTFNPAQFDINATDHEGRTALLWLFEATDKHDPWHKDLTAKDMQYITQLLLINGADAKVRTKNGLSVLCYEQVYAKDCFTLLHNAGAKLNTDSFRILCGPIKHNRLDILRKLIHLQVPIHQPKDWANKQCPVLEALYIDRWDMALLLLSHGQRSFTHHSRAIALEIIAHALLDGSIPNKYIIPLLYDVLHVKFIMQPDPMGQTFFPHYIHHLTQIIMCKDMSLLIQYLQELCTYVDMTLFLEEGNTLLMYLLKKGYGNKKGWETVFQYLAQHKNLLIIKDNQGFTPFSYVLQNGDLDMLKLFWQANAAILTALQPETSPTLMNLENY
jgi:ankyrin repeat protein